MTERAKIGISERKPWEIRETARHTLPAQYVRRAMHSIHGTARASGSITSDLFRGRPNFRALKEHTKLGDHVIAWEIHSVRPARPAQPPQRS